MTRVKRDPAAARAEWLGEWRDDIAAFLSRELVEAAVTGRGGAASSLWRFVRRLRQL